MKKALLRFFVHEDKSLGVKITCDEKNEGKEAPLIGISPEGEAVVSVLDFEIDYEKSGKLWFNQLNFSFGPDTKDETKEGCIYVKVKNEDDGIVNVGIQPLDDGHCYFVLKKCLVIPGTFFIYCKILLK